MPAFKSSLVALALVASGADAVPVHDVETTGYSDGVAYDAYPAAVQHIKTAEEHSLHEDGVHGLTVDEAEKHWETIATSTLSKVHDTLGDSVKKGTIDENKAKNMLLSQFHAVHDAAVLVEDELKAHGVIPADHHMPQPEQSTNHHGYQAPQTTSQQSANIHSYHAPVPSDDDVEKTGYSDDVQYENEVQRIKADEEKFLHARGVEGMTVDEAEKAWELVASSKLALVHDTLGDAVKKGTIDENKAKNMLLNTFHAVHDAAVLVEDELKAHGVIPADHHMPQPEQSTNHHGYQAPQTTSQADLDSIDAAQDRYNVQVKQIKAAMEGFLHDRGAEGHSVDDAERMWAIAARLTLQKEQKILAKAIEVGQMHQADAKDKLEDQYHAVIEAASMVEKELKADHIVPGDHTMPTGEPTGTESATSGSRTYEQTANQYGYTGPLADSNKSTPPAPAPPVGGGSIGPRWTYDSSVEAPTGTKDMGGWKASVYTTEQQSRLGVNEKGEPAAKVVYMKTKKIDEKSVAGTDTTAAATAATETTTAKVAQKSLRGKQEPTETQDSETRTQSLIAEPPTPAADTSSKPVAGVGIGPLIGFVVGGVALVALVGVGVAKAKSNKEQQSAQRLTESQNAFAVVQGSTDGTASPPRAVTQATFIQML